MCFRTAPFADIFRVRSVLWACISWKCELARSISRLISSAIKKKGWKMKASLEEAHLIWQQRWKKVENLDTVRFFSIGHLGTGCSGPVTGARLRFAGTPLGDVAPIYLCKNRTGHCCDNKDPDCFTPGGCFCDSSCRAFGKSSCFIFLKIEHAHLAW